MFALQKINRSIIEHLLLKLNVQALEGMREING